MLLVERILYLDYLPTDVKGSFKEQQMPLLYFSQWLKLIFDSPPSPLDSSSQGHSILARLK